MTYVFDRGVWKGRRVTDEAIRLGDLERFSKRLDRSVADQAEVGAAVDAEVARRKAAVEAQIAADKTPIGQALAGVATQKPAVPRAAGTDVILKRKMPCGHPVSDIDDTDPEHVTCQGCIEEGECVDVIVALGGASINEVQQAIKALTASLRKRLE